MGQRDRAGISKKPHHLCICHEAVKQGGFGAEIAAVVAEEAFDALKGPVIRLGAPFVPVPFAPVLEDQVRIHPEDIVQAIKAQK